MELDKTLHKQWRTSRLQLFSYLSKHEYFINKGPPLTNLKGLAFILKPLGLGGFKYPLQSGSHMPLYLNMGGVYKNCDVG